MTLGGCIKWPNISQYDPPWPSKLAQAYNIFYFQCKAKQFGGIFNSIPPGNALKDTKCVYKSYNPSFQWIKLIIYFKITLIVMSKMLLRAFTTLFYVEKVVFVFLPPNKIWLGGHHCWRSAGMQYDNRYFWVYVSHHYKLIKWLLYTSD